MGLSMKGLAKYVGVPTGILAGGAYLANSHPEVYKATGEVAGAVHGILDGLYQPVVEGLKTVPVVGEAAPFAFPVIAGGALGYKLSDALKIENKILRHITALTGAGLGAAASKSILAPYLALYGMYKTGKFVYDKQVVQRVVKGVINPFMKISEASKKLLIDPFIAAKKGLIDNKFEKPNFNY